MTETKLEQKLKEGVISQKEYDYLMRNRTSALPDFYKSFQFILFLILVPILQSILTTIYIRFTEPKFYMLIGTCCQITLTVVYFMIYRLSKKVPLKMAAWIWFVISFFGIFISIFRQILQTIMYSF